MIVLKKLGKPNKLNKLILLVLAIMLMTGTCVASEKRPWDVHYNTELYYMDKHYKCHVDAAKGMVGQGWSVDSMVDIMFAVCEDDWQDWKSTSRLRVKTFCENEKGYKCKGNMDALAEQLVDHEKKWRSWTLKILFENRKK